MQRYKLIFFHFGTTYITLPQLNHDKQVKFYCTIILFNFLFTFNCLLNERKMENSQMFSYIYICIDEQCIKGKLLSRGGGDLFFFSVLPLFLFCSGMLFFPATLRSLLSHEFDFRLTIRT